MAVAHALSLYQSFDVAVVSCLLMKELWWWHGWLPSKDGAEGWATSVTSNSFT